MPNKPLQYESSKTVLSYMDANVRLQISRCLPSIRSLERRLPLKIDDLYFQHMKTVINGTNYQLSVSRHYPRGTIQLSKEYSYDADKYGFDVNFVELTDGDVDLRHLSNRPYRDNDGDEARMREELEPLKTRLRDIEREMENLSIIQGRKAWLENEKLEISSQLNAKSSDLLKFDLRSFNIDPPYAHLIKLTIGNYNEYLEYQDKKLCQAMKYLNTRLFGARNLILVNKLSRWDVGHVVHLPVGFKIRIREINATYGGFNELQQILDESDLRTITTDIFHALRHPIIQKTENLIISTEVYREEDWLPFFLLKNGRVRWAGGIGSLPFSPQVCISLVQYWQIDGGRPIGTCYSFAVREERDAKRIMNEAREEFEHIAEEANGSLSFSMDTTSVVNFSYERAREGEHRSLWFLSLEIRQKIEQAHLHSIL